MTLPRGIVNLDEIDSFGGINNPRMYPAVFFRKSKVAVNDNAGKANQAEGTSLADVSQFTLIAFGASINGNIDSEGDVQVDGRVRGHVRAGGLTITADGAIEGEASAEDVIVQGYVKGPVRARHIHLLSGALVEGNLTCSTITIDAGARLSGTIRQEQQAIQDETLFLPEQDHGLSVPSIWDSRQSEGFRPLTAVRTRNAGR